MNSRQLTLGLSLRDDATFRNFYAGDNAQLVTCLKDFIAGRGEPFVYLWGESSAGRSHLLQACCHAIGDRKSVVYLALKDNKELTPAVLEGLEQMDLVCLDDIDAVLERVDWEEALFHFYNRARDNNTRLLVVGNTQPTQLPCKLEDLRSRLSWGLVFQVQGLDDNQKIAALQMHAQNRGILLSEEVGHYLLRHYPRHMSALCDVLEKLDEESLVEQRRITIPFVKQVLENGL